MNIELAKIDDIKWIVAILKERCDWLKACNIDQWGDYYYSEKYNINYFKEVVHLHKLYVVKQSGKVVGCFLLKETDETYWKNDDNAYYIHHLATKVGYPGLGKKIIEFIENLAKEN